MKAAGIPIATASSSKNADLLLRQVSLGTYVAERDRTLLDLVDADVFAAWRVGRMRGDLGAAARRAI